MAACGLRMSCRPGQEGPARPLWTAAPWIRSVIRGGIRRLDPNGGTVMVGAEEIEKAVGVGSVAFGAVATLTPRVFLRMYGLPDEANMRAMTRLWGTRTAVLGALVFTLEGAENKRTLMTMAAAMNAADALVVASAGGVSARARVLGSLTSAGFAGALAYMLSQ